jgi:1-acyl-sn-glycerol-3-phosphate acyltransferase
MSRFFNWFFMRLGGWKYVGNIPSEKKYIVISVPHTSMWDFVWGKFAFGSKNVHPVIFIKKESFFFPLNILLKWLGAKPVNRGVGASGLIEQVIKHFKENDEFVVCITPEGTREKVKRWKKGFYFIAQRANVPIYLGIIDYKNKIMTIGKRFDISDDYDKDMEKIKEYYIKHNPQAKYPEQFNWDIK